jgi:hypothetical protein
MEPATTIFIDVLRQTKPGLSVSAIRTALARPPAPSQVHSWVLYSRTAASKAALRRHAHSILLDNFCIGVDTAAMKFVSSTFVECDTSLNHLDPWRAVELLFAEQPLQLTAELNGCKF